MRPLIASVQEVFREAAARWTLLAYFALSSLFILIFAAAYYVTSNINPADYSEPLTRIDALYFSVTIFATVGFGDISARSDEARMLVTGQMISDLVLIGFIAKILLGVVQHRRLELDSTPEVT